MADTGEQPRTGFRWVMIYAAAMLFTLVSILALIVFSARFTA